MLTSAAATVEVMKDVTIGVGAGVGAGGGEGGADGGCDDGTTVEDGRLEVVEGCAVFVSPDVVDFELGLHGDVALVLVVEVEAKAEEGDLLTAGTVSLKGDGETDDTSFNGAEESELPGST